MKSLFSGIVLVSFCFLFSPFSAYADCGSDCVNTCDGKTGKAYEDCMVSCIQDCQKYDPPTVPSVPEPTPVTEPEKE
jgi:hypothetical protein